MAHWKKPACRVCGKTLDDHPDQPCPRGITPQYLTEKYRQEMLTEAAATHGKRSRQLNTRQKRPARRSTHKSLLETINRLKRSSGSLPPTAQKRQIPKHARTTKENHQKKKSGVYNCRQNFASKNVRKMEVPA